MTNLFFSPIIKLSTLAFSSQQRLKYNLHSPLATRHFLLFTLYSLLFTLYLLVPFVSAQTLKVVVTVGMIADVVKSVGADCVDVSALMGPGVDPHLYKASASDVRALQKADIIFYSGYHLEGQMAEVLEEFAKRKTIIAVAEKAISESELLTVPNATAIDPHVWMDVSLWARTADVIAQTLVQASPACKDAELRAGAYKNQLSALHDWIKLSIATIPAEQRLLITAHDAFYYYSRAYAIEVQAIQGVSTQSEASIDDIRQTTKIVLEKKIPAIFIESSINPRTIQAVLEAVQDQGASVIIGGQLYSDAMGNDGTEDGTYIGMLYHNTQAITTALGGETLEIPTGLTPWSDYWSEQ